MKAVTTLSLKPVFLILPEGNTSLDSWPSEFTSRQWLNTSSCKKLLEDEAEWDSREAGRSHSQVNVGEEVQSRQGCSVSRWLAGKGKPPQQFSDNERDSSTKSSVTHPDPRCAHENNPSPGQTRRLMGYSGPDPGRCTCLTWSPDRKISG